VNKKRTHKDHIKINGCSEEDSMADLFRDLASLLAISSFVIAVASWISVIH